jgi:transposase-like protein
MTSYSEKKQKQIAVHSLLNGFKSASESFAISESDAQLQLDHLLSFEIPLFSVIRSEILSSLHQKGILATSQIWGVSENLLQKLQKSLPVPESTREFKETGVNITPNELKTSVTVGVQPQGPNDSSTPKRKKKVNEDKRKVTSYSIEQKIDAVKEFVKRTNQSETARELQIPAVNLMRWRDKIRKEAFQEPHVENLYESARRGQRNKMFKELDQRVFQLFKENKDQSDNSIVNIAKELIRVDEFEPVVKDSWLSSFKKHFKLI